MASNKHRNITCHICGRTMRSDTFARHMKRKNHDSNIQSHSNSSETETIPSVDENLDTQCRSGDDVSFHENRQDWKVCLEGQ